MTDMNKPVKVIHDPVTGDIAKIENDMTITGRKKPDVGLEDFKLPSAEQMQREVATGIFSPESLAIANSILGNAVDIESAVDSYIDERVEPLSDASEAGKIVGDSGRVVDDLGYTEQDYYWIDSGLADYAAARHSDEIESTERMRRNAERKRIEAQRRDRSRMWREEATKSVTPATAHFKKIGTEAKKTTKAFQKLTDKMPLPGANLTYRPFLILSTIRDEFAE